MMKKVLLLCFISIFCALCFLPTVSAEAEASPCYVYDDMGVLSPEEIMQIEGKAALLSAEYGIDFYAVVTNKYGYNAERFCSDNRHGTKHFALLVITYNNGWYYDLYTYGKANRRISDSEADYMLDTWSVYHKIKNGNIAEGILAWQLYAHDACYMESFVPTALLVGGIFAGISALTVVLVYHTKLKKPNYPLDKYTSLRMTGESDVFITSHVTSRSVESSSGGKSGGGGRGHRGGR